MLMWKGDEGSFGALKLSVQEAGREERGLWVQQFGGCLLKCREAVSCSVQCFQLCSLSLP